MDKSKDLDYYIYEDTKIQKNSIKRNTVDKILIKQRCLELMREGQPSPIIKQQLKQEFNCSIRTAGEYLNENIQEIMDDFEDRAKYQRQLIVSELFQIKNNTNDNCL